MTIYVDDPMPIGGKFNNYCHMWADGDDEELHKFAAGLGLKRSWFQVSTGWGEFRHYDISPHKRALALRKGAVYMRLIEWIRRQREGKT